MAEREILTQTLNDLVDDLAWSLLHSGSYRTRRERIE